MCVTFTGASPLLRKPSKIFKGALLGNPAETSGVAGNAATASMSSFASGMSVKMWRRSSVATTRRSGGNKTGRCEGQVGTVGVCRDDRTRAFARKARRAGRARTIGVWAAGSGRTGGAEEQGEAQNADADAGGNASHVVGARTAVLSYDRAGECDMSDAADLECPRGFPEPPVAALRLADLPLKECQRGTPDARHPASRSLCHGAETPVDAHTMRFDTEDRLD